MPGLVAELDGVRYDVLVIGGGANGGSAAQHLAAAGYRVILAEKDDFASGTSSRSSRQLHCGLSYLAPGDSFWRFLLAKPRQLAAGVRMARIAMRCRSQLVRTMPERLRCLPFIYPIYKDGKYPAWQVDLGFRTLERFADAEVPLGYQRLDAEAARRKLPLVEQLRDQAYLHSVGLFHEYQYYWPERICIDTILDAERLGATVRNYTRVEAMTPDGKGGWRARLVFAQDPDDRAEISAAFLVNAAGPWTDEVNRLVASASSPRVIGIKGVNVMVRLPEAFHGVGVETLSRKGQAFYLMPWGDNHFFGPTETIYDGDPAAVRPEEEEIRFILDEANYLFPGLGLRRGDVLHAWAGVRPRTRTRHPDGLRAVIFHELAKDGLPNALAVTGAPIMVHRYVGQRIAELVRRRINPSGPERTLSHAARSFPENQNSPPACVDHPEVKIADLRYAARHEHVKHLSDLLFRRTSLAWDAMPGGAEARDLAGHVADILGWDETRMEAEVRDYESFLTRSLHRPASHASAC